MKAGGGRLTEEKPMASNDIEITLKDNSKEVLEALAKAIDKGNYAIGLAAVTHAKIGETAVDTGRLRNSITFATEEYKGQGSYSDDKGHMFADASALATPEEGAVYIGTNVEYAIYIEEGTTRIKALHMLRNAAANHGDEYKKLMEDALKSG